MRLAPRQAHIAAFGFFVALALLITWPLLTVIGTHFAGYPDGDAHEMTRHIWWFTHALRTGQPLIFQPLLAYPDGLEGVILWSNPLQFFPGWLLALALPLPAAYNLQTLLNLALNGWAAYWLVWRLKQQRAAALVAGVVFMAAPTMQGHLAGGHGGLMVQWPLPLLAYQLAMFVFPLSAVGGGTTETVPAARRLLLVALLWVLLPLGHTLQLIYAGLPLAGLAGLTLAWQRRWGALLGLLLAVGAGSLILALFLLPVAGATFGTSAYADAGGGVRYSIDLLALASPSFNHPVFGQWVYTHRVLGVNIVEGSGYIGLIPALLALVALWKNRAARWWLLLALIAWALALGPLLKLFDAPLRLSADGYRSHVALPWALLQDLPVLNLARTPGRFNFLLALAVSVLAGYGAAALSFRVARFAVSDEKTKWPGAGWPLTIALLAVIVFEYQSFWPLPSYPAAVPDAVRALAERDTVRAVFDLPADNLLAAKDALWLQTAHHKPLIAGQVTRATPVSPAKLALLSQTLDPALLRAAGADVVIVHKHYDVHLAAQVHERLGAPFFEDGRLALFDVPPTDIPPSWAAVSPEQAPITDRLDVSVYVPVAGWGVLEGTLAAGSRDTELRLNGQSVSRLAGDSGAFSQMLPFDTPGYHTITLAVNPACPRHYDETLECRAAAVTDLHVRDFTPARFAEPIAFDGGLTLAASRLLPDAALDRLRVALWWQFAAARGENDVRFVKVLDAAGHQVVGVDESLGAQPAGTQQLEMLILDLPQNLPPGTYRVYTGWYRYPDLQRFAVLVADEDGARDGLALVGEFAVNE